MDSGLQIKEDGLQLAEDVLVNGNSQWDADRFIEQIWRDLGGTTSYAQIKWALIEAAPAYENVRVKTYVPILLYRDVLEYLQDGLEQNSKIKAPRPVNTRKEQNHGI